MWVFMVYALYDQELKWIGKYLGCLSVNVKIEDRRTKVRTGTLTPNVCDHTTEWSFSLRYGVMPRAGVELTGIAERDGGAKVIADEFLNESRKEGTEGMGGQVAAERCCCE